MNVKIFWYYEILNLRSDDVTILRNVRNGHFGKKVEEKHNIICDATVSIAITTKIVSEKRQQIAELTETIPSCNYCVATIVARQLLTTVRDGNQPSGLQTNQA